VDNLIEFVASQGTIGRRFTFAMEEVRAAANSVRLARLVRSKAAVNKHPDRGPHAKAR
jgi:hypothetical protein